MKIFVIFAGLLFTFLCGGAGTRIPDGPSVKNNFIGIGDSTEGIKTGLTGEIFNGIYRDL